MGGEGWTSRARKGANSGKRGESTDKWKLVVG